MFVRIHKTSNMPGIRNHKGSSAMLITYLRDKCMASEEYYDNFFSHDMCHITPAEVIQRLDNNHRRLISSIGFPFVPHRRNWPT